jgi:hypothetical protein
MTDTYSVAMNQVTISAIVVAAVQWLKTKFPAIDQGVAQLPRILSAIGARGGGGSGSAAWRQSRRLDTHHYRPNARRGALGGVGLGKALHPAGNHLSDGGEARAGAARDRGRQAWRIWARRNREAIADVAALDSAALYRHAY